MTQTQDDRQQLTDDFWESLEKSRTVMLGSTGTAQVAARPMTAQVDDANGGHDIYFFASRDEGIGAEVLSGRSGAVMTFMSKDHTIYASAEGPLRVIEDQATIDRLWTVFAGLYYEDGKRDDNLLLLRFDPAEADVWRSSASGFLKAIAYKLIGRDAGDAKSEDRAKIAL